MSMKPVKKVVSNYRIVNRQGYFFGFHDKTPFSFDNALLLAHKYNSEDNVKPKPWEQVELGYFSGHDYLEFRAITKTHAWNWTQGAMLQWVGGEKNFIYNDFNGREHVATMMDISGNIIKQLPLPVGAVSGNGRRAISYNFARLRKGMPGYGYANVVDPDLAINIPDSEDSSLKLIDIHRESISTLFSVADIAAVEPDQSMENAFHYFTHCLFNPSGNRFVFFHRWLINNNRRYTRMISSDLNCNEIYIFPTSGMVSHIAWKDDRHILAYARTKEYNDKYYLFKDQSDDFEIVGEKHFTSDGHPQFSPDGRYILTDTYPDRFRRQHLILYDYHNDKRVNVASLQLPIKFMREARCDFHPRWNRDGTMICFDSAHTGKRSLCTIDLKENTTKDQIN